MCPTRHFVYIFFNPVFQLSTAKNEINLFNNHILIVAPVTFAPAGAMPPSAEFLLLYRKNSSNIFSSKTTGPVKAKYHMKPQWAGGTKGFLLHLSHMTRMVPMPYMIKTL